jgi:hypothetical protein
MVETLEIQPGHVAHVWFDLPLVEELLTLRDSKDGFAVEEQAKFLVARLPEIVKAFDNASWPSTGKKLAELQRLRARPMFGPLPGL